MCCFKYKQNYSNLALCQMDIFDYSLDKFATTDMPTSLR